MSIIFGDEECSFGLIMVEPGVGGFFVGIEGDVEALHLFGEVVEG